MVTGRAPGTVSTAAEADIPWKGLKHDCFSPRRNRHAAGRRSGHSLEGIETSHRRHLPLCPRWRGDASYEWEIGGRSYVGDPAAVASGMGAPFASDGGGP